MAVYRLLLIFSYSAKYIDEDQALMWWGTVLAAHFDLKEPHFLGQAYGTMFESIVAVPFYWIGVPLNIALPLATSLIWFLPFLICAQISLRNGKTKESVVIILISLLNRWDYDVLTTIPRSFISGFVFSFMGIAALIIGLK